MPILGQNSGYQTGNASANLIMPLSIESGSGELDFGDIILSGSGQIEAIRPENGKEFIVKGQANRSISVIYNDVELNNLLWLSDNGGSAGTLTFLPEVKLDKSLNIQSGDNIILEPEGLIGKVQLNVGGSINISPNQPTGKYEGMFIISVSY